MREIKFRAWNKAQQKMHPDCGYHPSMASDLSAEDEYYDTHEEGRWIISPRFDNYVLMQYTGLKDKNSKESYCKDIFQTQTGTVFYIDWNPVQHRWSCYDKNNDCRFHLNEYEDFEIIGNIYQNPELLTNT